MDSGHIRWVLAFDATCATCRNISAAVGDACGDRLEILPLGNPTVQQWLVQAEAGPRPVPTLFRVDGERVQQWTGAAMSARLVRVLGLRTSTRVLRALGMLRKQAPSGAAEPARTAGVSRKRFFELGAGGIAAVGILVFGNTPAWADPLDGWIKLTPAERSAAWVAHLQQSRIGQPTMTASQIAVWLEALALAANPANFITGSPIPATAAALSDRAIAVFGVERAREIFASLGPADPPVSTARAPNCNCSTVSDYCGGRCRSSSCTRTAGGCGFLYYYDCNGQCG